MSNKGNFHADAVPVGGRPAPGKFHDQGFEFRNYLDRWRRHPKMPIQRPYNWYIDLYELPGGRYCLSASDGSSGLWERQEYDSLAQAEAGLVTWFLTGEF